MKGTITTHNGFTARHLAVIAFDQDLRERQELGAARANAKGQYSIAYRPASLAKAEKGSADLVLEVRAPGGQRLHMTEVLFNAPDNAEINIILDGSNGESEFGTIKRELDRLLKGKDLTYSKLEEDRKFQDVTFVSGETGIEKEKITHFIVAHRLYERSKLEPES